MTPLTVEALKAPYEYVHVERHVRDVNRLLQEGDDGSMSVSVVLSAGAQSDPTELRGLGRDVWQGVDPREYIRELRDEWDSR